MSKDLNKWMGIGRLGQDPEIKYLPNGNAVANISLACGDDYKDKNTGQKVERTEWVRVTAFGRLGEIIGEYCTKGSKVYIEGKFTTRKWTAQDGTDRYTTEIVANEMQMLDSRDDSAKATSHTPAQGQQSYQQRPAAQAPAQAQPSGGGLDGFDSDIPF